MVKKVDLPNGKHWGKQKDALEHFSTMLRRYRNGDLISDPSDHDDLCALVQVYDTKRSIGEEAKAGVGISHFSRELNEGDRWRSPGFHVHRNDNSSIDFSFYEAVRSASY